MPNQISKNEQLAAILTAGIMASVAHSTDINTAPPQAVDMYEAVLRQLEKTQKQSRVK